MAKKQFIDKGLCYSATCGVRAVNLADYGVPCVPQLSRNHFTSRMPSVEEHVHVGFVEILYCLGGNITYESMGTSYPFRPGKIFVSRPDEPHRMVTYPKGLDTFSLLFRIPPKGARFLNLRGEEAAWLRSRMLDMPRRLFDGTDMTRKAGVTKYTAHHSGNRVFHRLPLGPALRHPVPQDHGRLARRMATNVELLNAKEQFPRGGTAATWCLKI